MIYMDNVAGTKIDSRVLKKMMPYFEDKYGNPSAHFYPIGRESYEAISKSRKAVSTLINASFNEIIFTSSGTESNNLAIKGILSQKKLENKKHIIISEIEHLSIQNIASKLLNEGYKITKLKVDNYGCIDPDDLRKAITKNTAMVSIMHANPEIGTIQDIKGIGEICRNHNIVFHVDAVASCGHIPVNVATFNCDLLSISAQNFYGPKGAAALYIKKGTPISPLFDGGYQEMGIRSGSENVPAIVGMGEAANIVMEEMPLYSKKMELLGKKLWEGLNDKIDFIHFTGHPKKRLPGHVSFWIEYIEGESLLLWFSLKGICAASGSACSSNILAEDEEGLNASYILTAVGVPNDICAGSLMFSMSKYSKEEDVDYVLSTAPEIVKRLSEMSPDYRKN